MKQLHILNHPLIQSKLTRMRDVRTDNEAFRVLLDELTALMVYEISRDYPLRERQIRHHWKKRQAPAWMCRSFSFPF